MTPRLCFACGERAQRDGARLRALNIRFRPCETPGCEGRAMYRAIEPEPQEAPTPPATPLAGPQTAPRPKSSPTPRVSAGSFHSETLARISSVSCVCPACIAALPDLPDLESA
jgi:hypothetical protein